jgi:hypothetical protein
MKSLHGISVTPAKIITLSMRFSWDKCIIPWDKTPPGVCRAAHHCGILRMLQSNRNASHSVSPSCMHAVPLDACCRMQWHVKGRDGTSMHMCPSGVCHTCEAASNLLDILIFVITITLFVHHQCFVPDSVDSNIG